MDYFSLDREQAKDLYNRIKGEYEEYKGKNLKLDMSRGKPSSEQISVSNELLGILKTTEDCKAENGFDCRNYGLLDGIPEAKRLFSGIIGVKEENVIVGGNSSLTMMYDTVSKAITHGFPESPKKWALESKVKFLCPVPGYDRHFGITQTFGIEMIPVPMLADGPDMDIVDELVKDPAVKGIWCVPKYSNPEGKTYSDEVVRRFASLSPAAPDFKIFWDNAYAIHDIYGEGDRLLSLAEECEKRGNPELPIIFSSTSKITFPGGGVAFMGGGKKTIDHLRALLFYQTISYDKLNQLRHVKFLKDEKALKEHMRRHAEMLRPKFELVLNTLETRLGGTGCGSWVKPRGGYFVSFDTVPGCAARTVALLKEAGVTMTPAGATYPYGKDPEDKNIRIAPTFPPIEELKLAMELFCICVKLSALQKILAI